eukprot:TRINITY_DN14177_c0_g1_i1.p1 TRINITY_DN14177_c0_g1~~TRINITY_DN14177_c0_g1_i1.p1  ORF type:complete len:179 (+),score=21.53 TRINITY_DN14177_c0_g1_i1:50-538(+)
MPAAFKPTSRTPEPMSIEDMDTTPCKGCSTTDIDLGAYLISHMRNICENCGSLSTPQWRKGWYSEVLSRSVLLCNACGLKYHKNQYCPYCKYVYGKEHDRIEDGWLTCQTCGRWVHEKCENEHNPNNSNRQDSARGYCCPGCKGDRHLTNKAPSVSSLWHHL